MKQSRFRKLWTAAECNRVVDLKNKGVPFSRIAFIMDRPESGVIRVYWAMRMSKVAESSDENETLRSLKK